MKKIELTEAEARALLLALSNVTDWPDAMEGLFPHHKSASACLSGQEKIRAAWAPEYRKKHQYTNKKKP